MIGKKNYQEKLFLSFQLSNRIPKDNFYRRLKEVLDLSYLYKAVKPYYGNEGQKSIDPTVFFRMMLIGYQENIISDRALIDHISMRLDLLYFIDYDIDDTIPWHSTISRTRKKLPVELFENLFDQVLKLCIEKGMVSGNTQAVDAAYVKANASLDSLVEKIPENTVKDHIQKVIMENDEVQERDKHTKEPPEWKKKEVEQRQKRQKEEFKNQPGNKTRGRYLSNHTHYSPTDPDAKGNYFMHYATSVADCRGCSFAKACKGKANERRLRVTVYKAYHDRMENRMLTQQGRKMRKIRQSTVEPVFGSLINFMGMRKINTIGLNNATKCMLMSAIAYNLKKYLKFNKEIRGTILL